MNVSNVSFEHSAASKHGLAWSGKIRGETKLAVLSWQLCKKRCSSYGCPRSNCVGALSVCFNNNAGLCLHSCSPLLLICLYPPRRLIQLWILLQSGALALPFPFCFLHTVFSHQFSSLLPFVVQPVSPVWLRVTVLGQGHTPGNRRFSVPAGGCVKHWLFYLPLDLTSLV